MYWTLELSIWLICISYNNAFYHQRCNTMINTLMPISTQISPSPHQHKPNATHNKTIFAESKDHYLRSKDINKAKFPSLSLTRRTLEPTPGGLLEEIKNLYDQGLSTATHYFTQWPEGEMRTVDLFTTSLEPKAAIVPGQETFLTLPLEERARVVKTLKDQKSALLFIGWVEKPLLQATSNKTDENQSVNLVGYAAIAAITDLKLFDKNGEIGLQVIGRCKIKNIKELNDNHCMVDMVPHRDTPRPFSNPTLTRTYIRDIHSLYDSCNAAEAVYREQLGQFDLAEVVKIRSQLHEKVDELIYEMDNPNEYQIAEYLSFCAMDYHFDAKTRCWALELQDTEARVSLVCSVLHEKLRLLKNNMNIGLKK